MGPGAPVEPPWAPPEDPLKPPPTDPLVLDLDGNGVQLISVAASRAHFDLDGDGFRERTGWVAPGDGLLVIDRNQNGAVDGISELFGNATEDGFVALAHLDTNADDRIDAGDQDFAKLAVWRDANSDGAFSAGELTSLDAAGVASISLATTASGVRVAGNMLGFIGTYTRTDGSTAQVSSAYFETNSLLSRWTPPAGFTAVVEASKLPSLKGYGTVVDLTYALSLDAQLLAAVKAYVLASDTMSAAQLRAGFEEILFKWTGTQAVASDGRGVHVDGRHLAVLEKFYDSTFTQRGGSTVRTDPDARTGKVLETVYNDLVSSNLTHLLSQVALSKVMLSGDPTIILESPFWPLLSLNYQPGADKLLGNVAEVASVIAYNGAALTGAEALAYYDRLMTSISGARLDLFRGDADAFATALRGGLSSINDLALREFGVARASIARRFDGASTADQLTGTAGDDVLWAKAGADSLAGGQGADTYVYAKGDGADTITETTIFANSTGDRVLLPGIGAVDVSLARSGDDLIVTVNGSPGDTLTVKGQFASLSTNVIETFVFADAQLTDADIRVRLLREAATAGNDTIDGFYGADTIDGQGGTDRVRGNGGGDTFLFNTGYGQLTIDQADYTLNPNNTLRFGAGITASQVQVTSQGNGDVVLALGSNGDRVTVVDELESSYRGVQQVQFADGAAWTRAQLVTLATTGTSGADSLYGTFDADTLDGRGGTDYAKGNGGSDTFLFNTGYGQLTIDQTDTTSNRLNTLRFGTGIAATQVKVTGQSNGDVVLAVGSNGDRVTLTDELEGPYFGVQQVQFADGTSWEKAQLISLATTGTPGADSLYGSAGADTIDGQGGTDHAMGNGGGDTFLFNAGYGQLTIEQINSGPSPDTLRFGTGITASQVRVAGQSNYDVVLAVGSNGDQVTLTYQLLATYYGLDLVQFADGTSWDRAQLEMRARAIMGTPGADSIEGTYGQDTIDGQGGTDHVKGNGGSDTFLFNTGYGQLTIEQSDTTSNRLNTLRFGTGIMASQVRVTAQGSYDVVLAAGSNGDQVTLTYQLAGAYYGVDLVQFADGTSWDRAQLVTRTRTITGTSGADTLVGTAGADTIDGQGGSDRVTGNGGSDTFLFNAGYGQLTIDQTDTTSNRLNTLRLGAGITASQVKVAAQGSYDVVLATGNSGDQVRLTYQLAGAYYGVDLVQFADGTGWDRAQLATRARTISGTSGADTLEGTTGADTIDGQGGTDYAKGNGGNDTFLFNAGYGQLTIEQTSFASNPSSTLRFGAGITAAQVRVTAQNSYDVVLATGSNGDQVRLTYQLAGPYYGLDLVQFADGTSWDRMQLATRARTITGTFGADTLVGTSGADTIDGQGGTDNVDGNGGGDTFLFNTGYGQLKIYQVDFGSSPNTLLFGAGIAASQVRVTAGGNDGVVLTAGSSGDRVTIDYQLSASYYGMDLVQFADGTSWDRAQLATRARTITGTPGADTLVGTSGADTLDGGKGNDRLSGGAASDVYVYASGDGSDLIDDGAASTADVDVLRFTDLNAGDITLSRVGSSLQVMTNATGETITIENHFYSQGLNFGVEQMQFAGGSDWDLATINANAWLRGTDGNDSLVGTSWNDTLFGKGGNDTLTGGSGTDRFVFGPNFGTDVITDFTTGSSGADVIEFSSLAFASFADVQAAMTQVGAATVITYGANTITLDNVAPYAFGADHFRFT